MSFFTFNIIGNAIDAYTQANNVTADNIANIGTPGASRQAPVITEATPISSSPFYATHAGSPGTVGEGAVVTQIARIHQDSYDAQYRTASSSQYFYTEQHQQLSSLETNFGEPSNGVSSAYAALQTSVSSAATSPTSTAVRQGVLSAAHTFATALNSASAAITQQKTTLVGQAAGVVTQANALIDKIAALNGQIRALSATGDNPNTFLDQRDYAIDQLSKLVPTTTALQANGSSFVTVAGRPVVNDTVAYDLAPPVIGTSANGTATMVVGFANDPNPSNPTPIPLASGQLGAFTDAYNNKLVPYAQKLDNIASSAVNEMNRITQAGVDQDGNAGTALFTVPAGTLPVTAASIGVAITDPRQIPLGLISTNAGSLTQAMNSANNSVLGSAALDGNATLFNPPPAATGLQGTLTVNVDGTGAAQTFAYDTTGNAATINGFMTSFNARHFGVTASFDPTTQKIGFTRDPNNADAVHRALQGQTATTDGFTITDSLLGATPPAALPQGASATGLLQTLGAANINGVAQTPLNAYGASDNGGANALLTMFSQSVGIGALQTTAGTVSGALGAVTIVPPSITPSPFSTIVVGQQLTIVNAALAQQNVFVTAVNRATGSITVSASAAIAAGDSITTTASQTLGASYGALISQMGLDVTTATTGLATQTALASGIDSARQSVDGINIDEETQNLLKFQNAYTAAAKTLSVLNAMMQTTLGLIQ